MYLEPYITALLVVSNPPSYSYKYQALMASGDTTQQGGSSQVPRGAPQGISLEFLLSLQTPVQPSMSSIEEHSSAEAKAEGLTHLNDWDAETQIKSSLIDPESHITKEQVKVSSATPFVPTSTFSRILAQGDSINSSLFQQDLRNESGKIVERMVSLQKQFQTTVRLSPPPPLNRLLPRLAAFVYINLFRTTTNGFPGSNSRKVSRKHPSS